MIDLIWLGETAPAFWSLGAIYPAAPTPHAVHRVLEQVSSRADFWLFWHPDAGHPDPAVIQRVSALPGDGWHAGLRMGMGGLPRIADFVHPTWMLNCDPSPDIEASSWRLSLWAFLVRREAVEQLGGIDPGFETLVGAGLELGHRYMQRGVMLRHIPSLIEHDIPAEPLPLTDELRFARCRYSRFWNGWAHLRMVMTGCASPLELMRSIPRRSASDAASQQRVPTFSAPRRGTSDAQQHTPVPQRVTVLIPTIDRYPYLRVLLGQLREQTVAPLEILVIDQTAQARRDTTLQADFPDLPLHLITLDAAGQCSSRNAGLQVAQGDYVLFIDDDDEVNADLIERHLHNLAVFQSSVSCGTAHEVDGTPLPENFTFRRTSDGFPTNNALIEKAILRQSGLFDLAYERMSRADGDLGMRIYLSGALMVYDPAIGVLHHHAPRGGLRTHKARVITYGSSRRSLTQRHLPSISEVYLALRYFTPAQVREKLWQSVFGVFAGRGSAPRRLLKVGIQLVLFPDTLRRLRRIHREAVKMLERYPQIPTLPQ